MQRDGLSDGLPTAREVRLGKMVPMDSFQKLDFAHYYIPPEEAQLVLHIEDPFEVAC